VRAVRLGLITATALTVLGQGAPAALAVGPPAAAGLKTVSYRGYEFAVPAGWPVSPGQPALRTHSGAVADYVIRGRNLFTYTQSSPGASVTGPRQLTTTSNLTGTPVAVQAANGTISVYARTTGGAVQAAWQTAAGGAITKRRSLGGKIIGSPAAGVTAGNTIAVYGVGTNRQLYSYAQPAPGAAFTGPVKLSSNGGLTGTLIAIPNANGTVSVFARTVTGALRAKWQSAAGGPFASSASLGGHIAGDLAGVAGGDGAVSLYGTGTDSRQYTDRHAAAFGAFGGWVVI
jgi:hypothetical protein